jgi:hypothetical protein
VASPRPLCRPETTSVTAVLRRLVVTQRRATKPRGQNRQRYSEPQFRVTKRPLRWTV